MKYKTIALILVLFLFITVGYANPKLARVRVEEVSDNSVYLIGRVNNFDNISEYGFAYSEFPLPPILEQNVNFIRMSGKPFEGTNFSLYLDELQQGKHYFFSVYYVINGKYHYSESYSYSTQRTAKINLETKTIDYTTDSITMPINIIRSREVLFGQFRIKFDHKKINIINYKLEGLPVGSYQRGQITENRDHSILEINFFLQDLLALNKIKTELELRLDRTINQTGFTTIEFDAVELYQKDGKRVDVDYENGTIHYQYKGSKDNLYDKIFSDNDLIYRRNIENLPEFTRINHTSQVITTRWRMGIPVLKRDNSRIEIHSHYYATEYPKDKEEQIEKFVQIITPMQREDLSKQGVDLIYTNPQGIVFRFRASELEDINLGRGNWEISSSTLTSAKLKELNKMNIKIIDSYEVSSKETDLAEIRFPVSSDISQKDLRIISINEKNQEKTLIPYYFRRADGSLFACIEDNPNAIFILTVPEKRLVETVLGSNSFFYLDKTYEIEGSYLNDDNHLMLPARILEEFYDLKVTWNINTAQLRIFDGRELIFTINSNIAIVNGTAHLINNKPEYKNNRVYIPREVFEKIFEASVTYNNNTGLITIRY